MSQSSIEHIKTKLFVNPALEANAQACVEFIRENLKRDQIVSISHHETQIEEGQSSICLVYRSEAINKDSTPFDEIEFFKLKNMVTWEVQGTHLQTFLDENPCQTVALTHTPRNIMGLRNGVVWYTKTSPEKVQVKYLKDETGNWDALIKRCSVFLNSYIAPHQLVNVDFFEDSHPNLTVEGDLVIYCTIVHTAGDDPALLSLKRQENTPEKIFHMWSNQSGYDGDDTEMPYEQACIYMNKFGWDQGFVLAGFNVTAKQDAEEDHKFNGAIRVVLFSWNRVYEDQMKDVLRPSSCMDNCTIF